MRTSLFKRLAVRASRLCRLPRQLLVSGRSGDARSIVATRFEPLESRVLLSAGAPSAPIELLDVLAAPISPAPGVVTSTPHVVGRHIFYNNSAFDTVSDDHAIAPSPLDAIDPLFGKEALLPGRTATFQNYTSYHRGINGIMIDVADLTDSTVLSGSDFVFQVGNLGDPSSWVAAPPLAEPMGIRPEAGVDNSDRYTFIWNDDAIQNMWLQAIVKASDIGIGADDIFYFGNAIGEIGDQQSGGGLTASADVGISDLVAVRQNATRIGESADIENPFDFNRDTKVNLFDLILARDGISSGGAALRLTAVSLFEDVDVEDGVRKELHLSAEAPVTPRDVLGLTALSLDSIIVDSLVGLEFAVNLESLTLTPTNFAELGQLSTLAPLSGLEQLKSLTLQRADIDSTELASLGSLASLESLDLRYNDLSDLVAISNFPSLNALSVYGNPLDDVSALAGTLIDVDLPPIDLHKAQNIDELAASLHYLPIQIFEYVVNNFEFEPYDGAMKGAQAVLETKAGNDWDQSLLLAELFNTAGVTTRYVTGQVDVPVQEVMDWLGVTDSGGAGRVLASAGLNSILLVDNQNTVVNVRFDHAWLEAQLVVPGEGTQWIAMDPSWKFKEFQPGFSDIFTLVPFDESGYLSEVRKESALEFYEGQVRQYLKVHESDMSIADIPYDGLIIPQQIDTIPDGLPYAIHGETTIYDVLPDGQTHRVEVSLAQGGSDLFRHLLVLPDTSQSRITIGYESDGSGLAPQLRLDGVVVAAGAAVADRSDVQLTIDHFLPGETVVDRSFEYTREAGQYIAVGLNAKQISSELLLETQRLVNDAAIARLNNQPFSQDDQIGGLLALAGMKYIHDTSHDHRKIDGLVQSAAVFNRVASGITSSETTVSVFPDLQIPFIPDELGIDVKNHVYDSFEIDDDTSTDQARRTLALHNSSFRESALWEELVNIDSISTIKSLQVANDRGIPVFVINMSNVSLVDQLTHSPSIKESVRTDVLAGATVTIPRDPTVLQEWDGVGYITDRGTEFGYIIAGGIPSPAGVTEPKFYEGGFSTGAPDNVSIINPPTGDWVQQHVGDPINIANGSVTHDEFDISLPGVGIPLQFGRFYDSINEEDRGMGAGWSLTYSDRLTFDADGSVTWLDSTGNHFIFAPDGNGGFVTPESIYGTFTNTGSGFLWRDKSGLKHEFDSSGKLVKIQDRYGNGYLISYDASDQIATVSDLVIPSRTLTFTYTEGRVASISDFTGRSWTYAYVNGRLSHVTHPTDADTPLASVQYTYYTDPARDGLLHQVINPDGGMVQYSYYANRRGFEVTDPEGFRHNLSYNTFRHQTAFTDERGHTSVYTHNDQGNLIHLLHPDRSTQETEWVDNLKRSTTDAFGQVESYEYDGLGNLIRIVDRADFETVFTYEPQFNLLASSTRPGNRTTSYTHDAVGNLNGVEDAEQNVSLMTYDSRGQLLTRTSPKGGLTPQANDFTTTFTYDSAGNVLSLANDLPSSESFTYDGRGNLLSRMDANQHITTYSYDLLDRQLREIDPFGHEIKMAYDNVGNLVAMTDELSRTTTFQYDLRQRQIRAVNPDGTVFATSFNPSRSPSLDVDELGQSTQYRYDSRNRLTTTVYADASVEFVDYDGNSRVTRTVDSRGNAIQYSYDALDRLATTTDALNQTTTRAYDPVGNLIASADALHRVTTYTYDKRNLRKTISGPDPDGAGPLQSSITQFDYDANSNLIMVTDPLNHTTRYGYDVQDREMTITNALDKVTTKTYDAVGNLKSITDPESNTTTYTYDKLDRQITNTNELGAVRTFGYNAVGNLVSVVDRSGRQIDYSYDSRDRRFSETWLNTNSDPVRETTWVYDAVGQLLSATDPDSTYFYTYDSLGRVLSANNGIGDVPANTGQTQTINGQLQPGDQELSFGGGNSSFFDTHTFDTQVGDEVTITMTSGDLDTFLVLFSPTNQQTQEDGGGGGTDARIQFTATEAGQWTIYASTISFGVTGAYQLEIQTPSAVTPVQIIDGEPHVVIRYEYDVNGNVLSIADTAGGKTTYVYDVLNRTERLTQVGQGVAPKRVDFDYDAASQLASVTRYADSVGSSLVAASTYTYDAVSRLTQLVHSQLATTIVQYDWTYDAAHRITQMIGPDGSTTYNYDNTDQLAIANHSFQTDESYTYDDNGNRTNVGYTTTTNNRLQSDSVYLYEYDAEGNRISRTNITTDEVTKYDWDHRNRLTRVVTKSASDQITKEVKYTYDMLDRRIAKSVDEDDSGPGTVTVTHFVYDGTNIALEFDGLGNQIHRYLHGPGIDQILADERADGTVHWAMADHQGTVRDIVDSAGVVQNHIQYDSFGKIISESNAANSMRFGYTGRERDLETDLYYYRARYYDPGVGRFVSEDSIGFASGDVNLSRYVLNNPLQLTDPSGNSAVSITESTSNSIVGPIAEGIATSVLLPSRYGLEPARGATVTGIRDLSAGRVNAAGNAVGDWLVRLDSPHKGTNFPHINLNPNLTGVSDPHLKISPGMLRSAGTGARILNATGKIAVPLAVGVDSYRLYNAYSADGGQIGDNTIRTGASIAGGWTGAAVGGAAGAKGGAAIGGAIGAFFGGVGAAPGAAIGGILGGIGGAILGAFGGSSAGEAIADSSLR